MADNGPYESERAARTAALAAIPPEPGWSILRTHQSRELLARALEAAGVETSPYEDGTVAWLAGFEDTTCQVIAGWVLRAAGIRECRHCGGLIRPCTHDTHWQTRDYPLCKGWRHVGHDDQPVIGHCCEGRSVNSAAEPREDGERD